MSQDTDMRALDPVLVRLADAILIPPFPGPTAPDWILRALERGLAGVTLFGQNIFSPDQVSSLTAALRSAASVSGDHPVIAIDEEGGDVTRVAFSDGSPYPGNAALGAVDDVALTRAVYQAIGLDLAALGINFNLAPCADVLGLADTPAVGTRSFGPDTDLVSRHTAAAVVGLQGAGLAACTKHFPGHGRTDTDTHEAIAVIEGGLDELRRHDLPPFAAAIKAGTAAVMPSHLRLPELTGDLPATVSGAALTELLRGELGFTGVIVSDALEMRATRETFGVPQAAVLAVAAGTDLLCLGRDNREQEYLAVREALAAAVHDGALAGERLEEAADRVARLRGGLTRAWSADAPGATPWSADAPGAPGSNEIGLVAARRAVRMSGPRPSVNRPVIIEVEPRENIAAGRFTWGLGPWAAAGSVRRINVDSASGGSASGGSASGGSASGGSASGGSASGGSADMDDGGRDGAAVAGIAARILAEASGRSLVVAFRDAHRNPKTRALITALLGARPDTVLVEMGLPRWQPPEGTSYVATYGASRASAQAAAEVLGLV
jgi:beta-N-acetylhexosaminidase